ncbi:hypothetical protein GGI25_005101 [Coemansia spiralis]|uniref:C2H2-type domain-containing protein n=2 Tax=Coemansia TaxID=4863 RepID=A0A9W8G5C0_9FUNG|nr:hypothetical protein EDC05_005008 [Coemansia umbellata]KAJ2620014.1 hypothetical protein GGI26_005363 [Coemansia sp. RSA 1358]KAJ2672498.1 hypothetical protein GGI25_005101 [Coemansia spiralis]
MRLNNTTYSSDQSQLEDLLVSYIRPAPVYTSRPPPESADKKMNNNNIVAIPRYPPLPSTVSGVFPTVEQPHSSTSKDNSKPSPAPAATAPVGQQPSANPQNAALGIQIPRFHHHRQSSVRMHPYASTDTSYARHGGRPRSNSGHTFSVSSETPFEPSSASISTARYSIDPSKPVGSMRPPATSKKGPTMLPGGGMHHRDSAASHTPLAVFKDSNKGMGVFNISHKSDFTDPVSAIGMSRHMVRQDSISSEASALSFSTKSVGPHTGERKYVCDWHGCTQAFDRIEHLNRHKRRHTGEKPYCCLVARCSKLFSRFDNMMQHVGIHNVGGLKTEIPNIKNLNIRGNGRGRARRTSYRGAGDPCEKFRRHVESALGTKLADGCVFPTDHPDFSNLTLRPLLNFESDAPPSATPESAVHGNNLLPISATAKVSPAQQLNASQQQQRARHDSVVDGMDHAHVVPSSAASSSHSMSGKDYFQYHAYQPSSSDNNQQQRSPSSVMNHRNSLGLVSSLAQTSNVRGQLENRR